MAERRHCVSDRITSVIAMTDSTRTAPRRWLNDTGTEAIDHNKISRSASRRVVIGIAVTTAPNRNQTLLVAARSPTRQSAVRSPGAHGQVRTGSGSAAPAGTPSTRAPGRIGPAGWSAAPRRGGRQARRAPETQSQTGAGGRTNDTGRFGRQAVAEAGEPRTSDATKAPSITISRMRA